MNTNQQNNKHEKIKMIFEMKNKFLVLVILSLILSFALSGFFIFSQRTKKVQNQISLFELLNGIREKAEVEGYGILEYELYNVPGNDSSDFMAFIWIYTQTLDEYVFDQKNKYWIKDNTELSKNVKLLMTKHKRNLSITKIKYFDGTIRFIFNCLNSIEKYEYYNILAYEKNINNSLKTTKIFFKNRIALIKQCWTYFWKRDYYTIISNLTEILFNNFILYFPINDNVELKRITDHIYHKGESYTITANGYLKGENSKIARQIRNSLIIDEIIPLKLFLFINIDKERDLVIRDTIDKVAKKFEAEEDSNGDGKTNCQDAAIWFYFMYPFRNEVKLTVNDPLNHAFNTVKIGDTWKCIEPQEFEESKNGVYLMEDVWGSQYDSSYNEDGSFLLMNIIEINNKIYFLRD
jgi:hypothetical protein